MKLLISFSLLLLSLSVFAQNSYQTSDDKSIHPRMGWVSTSNSSNTALAGDAVFTGVAEEVSQFASIAVFAYSDVASSASGFVVEFSTDGTNWDRSKAVTLAAGVSQTHILATITKYFRVVFTNGSSAQTAFRLQVIYHVNKPRDLSSGTTQPLQKWDDVTLVRNVSDPKFDRVTGRVAYESTITMRGGNDTVGTSYEDVTDNAVLVFPTIAETVRVKAGGNTNDTAAGSGCQSVKFIGLDENFDDASETEATAGSSASTATTITFIRLFSAICIDVGTYGSANTAAITIENTSTNAVLGLIPIESGTTQSGFYTCPNGHNCYANRGVFTVSDTNTATIEVYARYNADDVTTPFSSKVIVNDFHDIRGINSIAIENYPLLPAKTDIWATAKKVTGGGSAEVNVAIDFIKVAN